MQQVFVVDASGETSTMAAAAEAANPETPATDPQLREPPPAPKKKAVFERGEPSKEGGMAALAETLHTPVTDKTSVADLEKIRSSLVKQTEYLESRHAEVQVMIKEAKEENAKITAKLSSQRNLFTTTPLPKPAGNVGKKSKKGRDPSPDNYKSPAQRLGFEWATAPQRKDKNGDVILCTPVLNTAAALDILNNDDYNKDDKIYFASILTQKALEQQARADSHAHMADARGGKLESKSNACKAAAGGQPEDPSGSSSHGKGKDKPRDKDPRKSPPPRRQRDEASRTGNLREDLPPPPPRRDEGGSRGNQQPPRSGGNRDKSPPPRRSRDRTVSPPPPPRREGGSGGHNGPRHSRAAQDEPQADRSGKKLAPEDARHRLNDIKAGKEDAYLGPECFGPAIRNVQIPRDMTSVSKTHQRYNGADKPNSWLSDYALAVEIAGGNGLVAARFLPLMLEGTARSWIENLPEKSIHSWHDMEKVFTQHF
jgi:hypothetical protein